MLGQDTNSHKIKTAKIGFVLILLFFNVSLGAYTLPLIPDKIPIPKEIKHKSAGQIKAVFSSLEQQHNKKTANLWLLHYQKALWLKEKDQKTFCLIMKELGTTPAFPLNDLALIESYELCPYLKELEFDAEKFPKWLRLRLAQAFYKRRKVFANPKQTLEATIYLAQNSTYKELKVSYLKHALGFG